MAGSLPPMTTLAELGGWPAVLGPLLDRQDLPAASTRAAMAEILEGAATPAQLAGFVVALRMKGETVDELTGLLDAMLDAAALVDVDDGLRGRLVDIVGTGGDRSHTINVSTLASFVVAGGGVPVCKHGNRAASSACGSADLLEALGVRLELTADDVVRCIETAGMAFCFAPRFHPALRHAGPSRRELGVPTAFNILGPMANPARVRRLVVGLADASLAERMLGVLANHGALRVMIVHGDDGLDELTTTAPSTMLGARRARHSHLAHRPGAARPGARPTPISSSAAMPATNAGLARAVLAGERGPHRDVVVLNAAAGLLMGDAVDSMAEGVKLAGGGARRRAGRCRAGPPRRRIAGVARPGHRRDRRTDRSGPGVVGQPRARLRRARDGPVAAPGLRLLARGRRPPHRRRGPPRGARLPPRRRRGRAVWVRSPIPMGRGLGFSGRPASAGAGGRPRATVRAGARLADVADDVLALASELEGHADNVAASLHGGVVATAAGRAVRVPLGLDPAVVLWVPSFTTSTDQSRTTFGQPVAFDGRGLQHRAHGAAGRRAGRRRRRRAPARH